MTNPVSSIPASRVFAFGETLLDVIFDHTGQIKAVPGGSVVNAAISLSRMGIAVELLSEYGNDLVGSRIDRVLQELSIGHNSCVRYPVRKTTLAMAFLNTQKDAAYEFYHDYPDTIENFPLPDFQEHDFLLFGSYYSVKPERKNIVGSMLAEAAQSGATILYDPNIRKNHRMDSDIFREDIRRNLSVATLVKGSVEDFGAILGIQDPMLIYAQLKETCPYLIVTAGQANIHLFTPQLSAAFQPAEIEPVSTIGAGDNFNAGILYGMVRSGVNKRNIARTSQQTWDAIIRCGIQFATATCLSMENSVPITFKLSENTKFNFESNEQ